MVSACVWPTLLLAVTLNAATLGPTTLKAWDEYAGVRSMEMERRLNPGNSFLWVDEVPERLRKVRSGEIVVSPIGLQNPKRVPSGLIHDWLGAAFIAHGTIHDVLAVVRDYARYKDLYRPTIMDSKVIATGEAKDRFSMLLNTKSPFLKTVLDTDSEANYVHVDNRRAYSIARTTRIQEIAEYGSPDQRILGEGEGVGLIWRLLSITRYAERDGGVFIEFEVIGLSRDIPNSLRWLVEPIVRHASRRSLLASLQRTATAVRLRGESTAAGYRESTVPHR